MRPYALVVLVAAGCIVAVGFFGRSTKLTKSIGPTPFEAYTSAARAAKEARGTADLLYSERKFPEAATAYREFVEDHRSSPDPQIQDEVGAARIRLGYTLTKEKDWQAARAAFQEASTDYRGTGQFSADFGGIPDQAAYQAAVCLEAEGKKDAAIAAYRQFFEDHRLSPLVHAVFKRLTKIHDGAPQAQDEALLQAAVKAQEDHIRFERSVCGPKSIAYLLKLLGKPEVDYRELAKFCGTDEGGTTMEGMKKGLLAQGVRAAGFLLDRKDFVSAKLPLIWLQAEHYLVVTRIQDDNITCYNPIYRSEQAQRLPAEKEPFAATVLQILSTNEPLTPRKGRS